MWKNALSLKIQYLNTIDKTGCLYVSTIVRTQSMREFPDFPMDCYVIESLGIDNIVIVQKTDGKVYQYAPGEDLEHIANSFGEYLLGENEARKKRSDYWKGKAKDL